MTITLRGAFAVRLADGRDATPAGQKERALLALLALSPDRRRARLWLRDRLWSTRSEAQAGTSLRRALANIRQTLGPARHLIGADAGNLWLEPGVALDLRPELAGRLDLLEDLNVRDPEFDDWLREQRQADAAGVPAAPVAPAPPPRRGGDGLQPAGLIVERPPPGATPEARYLAGLLADGLAQRLHALGDAGVRIVEPGEAEGEADIARRLVRISVESVVAGGRWHVHLRGSVAQNRQFLWSGRMTQPADVALASESPELAAFVSRATTGILSRFERLNWSDRDPFLRLQRAARRVFSGDLDDLTRARVEFESLLDSDVAGLAQAWLSFALLTEHLETAGDDPARVERALAHAAEAARRAPDNPLALALAAQVEMKLGPDPLRGAHLARLGHDHDDQNPWALHALSQALALQDDPARSARVAEWARLAARGLVNEHCWDMQLALARLAAGDLPQATSLVAEAHAKAPSYRPALRYLIALHAIAGDTQAVQRHLRLLALVEPGFAPAHLLRPDYPLDTLRRVGLAGDLKGALT